jgi:hypothetical protein
MPANNPILCTLNEPTVPELAKQLGNTRMAAALELWRPHLAGAIVVIGNAPTALFRLLDMLDAGAAKPALILGFPVGFVGGGPAAAARPGWGLSCPIAPEAAVARATRRRCVPESDASSRVGPARAASGSRM